MADEGSEEDRLFVRDGWRHYRRRYSLAEVRWGLATFAALVLLVGWVIWRGQHPDPSVLGDPTLLLEPAGKTTVPVASAPPTTGAPVMPAAGEGANREGAGAAASGAAGERGPLPAGLAGAGWKEDKVAVFDEENLYVKINGRADYFRAFAFRKLHSVLLTSEADAAVTVDFEMYDLTSGPNALGAYSGERPPNAKVEVTDAGLHHFDRNALYLARGPYYIRVIGSDETPVITEKLRQIAEVVKAGVKGEPLPWAYGLFIGQMSYGADKITYSAKNAFSLGFADDVWAVRPEGKETDLELFVSARKDAADARALAGKLRGAFLELGQPGGKAGGIEMVKDQFLGLYAGVVAQDHFVIGARGGKSAADAAAQIGKLKAALGAAPEELRRRAVPAPAAAAAPATAPGKDRETPAKSAGGAPEGDPESVPEK